MGKREAFVPSRGVASRLESFKPIGSAEFMDAESRSECLRAFHLLIALTVLSIIAHCGSVMRILTRFESVINILKGIRFAQLFKASPSYFRKVGCAPEETEGGPA